MNRSNQGFIKTGVIGFPISHSLSPVIHNHWIEKYGLSGSYEALNIPPKDLETDLQRLIREGFKGFNLTVPHKELVIPLCDDIDDTARIIGAVNTLWVEDERLKGTNTDKYGFIENLKAKAPGMSCKDGPAVVLGAGGAARAVIRGLLDEGAPEIRLINRTAERAEKLAEDFREPCLTTALWSEKNAALADAALLVNTTTLGMRGQPPLDISLDRLPANAPVCDIVYNPLETKLLGKAKARGHITVDGLGMLLHQARPAFERWYGVLPEIDEDLIIKVKEALR